MPMTLIDRQHPMNRKARRSLRDGDRFRGVRDALIHFRPRIDWLEERRLMSGMTYMVTSTADSVADGTLREAIIEANANPGNNTIEFDLAASSTISLTLGPLVVDPATTGDGLNIINSGAGAVTIDAAGNGSNSHNVNQYGASAPNTSTGQIFVINAASGDVQIAGGSAVKSITLRNATTADYGGAIDDLSSSVLDVDYVMFTGNTAVNGGAIEGGSGFMDVSNCTFGTSNLDFNTATGDGGAIDFEGADSLTVSDSHFNDNQSNGGYGGAIRNFGTDGLVVEGSTFTGNEVTATVAGNSVYGGAIYTQSGNIVIDSSAFTSNEALGASGNVGTTGGGSGEGGAIFNTGSAASVTSTSFTSNKAQGGTGYSETTGNSDGGDGGAGEGGAFYQESTVSLTVGGSVTFTNNAAIGGAGGSGSGTDAGGEGGEAYAGALDQYNSDSATISATFSANSASGGAGAAGGSTSGNGGQGGDAGGGALDINGNTSLSNSAFTGNSTTSGTGGAGSGTGTGGAGGNIYGGAIGNDEYFAVSNTTIVGTTALSGAGGVGGSNSAGTGSTGGDGGDIYGGAVFNENNLSLDSVTITGTNVQSGAGGAGGNDTDDSGGDTGGAGGNGGAIDGGVIYNSSNLSGVNVILGGSMAAGNTALGGVGGAGGKRTASHGEGGAGGRGGAIDGGGLYDSGYLSLSSSTVSCSTATGGAGGVGGTGSASNDHGGGGGAGGTGGEVQGGGIYEDGTNFSGGILTISHNTATGGVGGAGGNHTSAATDRPGGAGGDGGDVYGGGLDSVGTISLIASSAFIDNTATAGAGGNGGSGVVLSTGGAGGDGGTVAGGGVGAQTNLTLSLDTLSGNLATAGAGGNGGTGTVAGLGGDAGDAGGGGVGTESTLTLIDSTITNNAVTAGLAGTGDGSPTAGIAAGGGVGNLGDAYVTQSTITGNTAEYGGGVANAAGTLDLSFNTITGNTATMSGGGGVYNVATIFSAFNTITGNTPNQSVGVSADGGMTYVVTSTADSTSGNTLRHAIVEANANAGNNTIEFNFANNSTISLTLGPLVIDPSTAGYGLNIINTGAGTVTIDAAGNGPNASNVNSLGVSTPNSSSGRIFEIDTESGDVQIGGQSAPIILQNAYANSSYGSAAGYGGAIVDESIGILDVADVDFLGNAAAYGGGAIYENGGPMYVTDSSFGAPSHGNKATGEYGGAINDYGGSSLTVNDTSFNSNLSSGTDAGAIYAGAAGGLAVLGGSTFTNNAANGTAALGGAIYQEAGPFVLDSSTFTGNKAQGGASGGFGGAISLDGGTTSITNTTFTGNKALGGTGGAAEGGALYGYSALPLSVGDNVSFTDNTAQGGIGNSSAGGDAYGGAVYIDKEDPVVVDATFTSNSAIGGAGQGNDQGGGTAEGGTIYNYEYGFLLNDSTITDSSAQGGAGSGDGGDGGDADGDAIYVNQLASDYSPFVIANTAFTGTQAIGGAGGAGSASGNGGEGGNVYGGVFYGDDEYVMISDSTFTKGTADGGAGGIGSYATSPGPGGTGGAGGGVEGGALLDTGDISLLDVTLGGSLAQANTALGGAGGTGGAADGSSSGDYGGTGGEGGSVYGGATADAADVALGNSVVSYNIATGGAGGNGGAAGSGSSVGGDGGAGGDIFGGGIYDYGSNLVGGVTISDNTATGGNGGNATGVGGAGGGTRVTGGDGGYVEGAGYCGENQALIANGTISGNTASGGTGGDATSSGFTGGGAGGGVEGGGVYNYGSLGLSLDTFSGNTTTGGAGGGTNSGNVLGAPGSGGSAWGGAVGNENSLGVIGSTFSANVAVGGAAGTGNVGGTAGYGYGGGLYNDYGGYVKDSTFSGNSADYGGGLYNDAAATLDLSFSTLNHNIANISDPNVGNLGTFIDAFNIYIVASPIVVTAPSTQSSTAGVSHAFSLGSFSDPNEGATSWTEIINWGDSTTSTLHLHPGSLGTLAHTYATAAAYTATVTVTDNVDGTGSNSFTANVSPAIVPITVTSPGTQSSTAEVSHVFSLGSFSDTNGGATSWTEIINWGDSTTGTLHLSPGSLGTLAHTYAAAAAYTVTVSVTDNLTATGSNTFSAYVSAPISPIIVTSPATQSSTAGTSHAFVLGSFTDPNGGATSWTEIINWGDSTSGTLNLPPGALGSLAHTYASSGAYSVTVTVTDNLTATGYNTFTASVSAPLSPIIVTSPGTQASTAGVSHTFAMGSFTDPNGASSWTETINWGDSSSSTLNLPPGSLGNLAHTYASSRAYSVTVTVTDNFTATGYNTFTTNVSAAISPITVTSPGTQASTAGVSHTFSLGSFSDPNEGATSWTENINWGDSTASTLHLHPGSLGTLDHTYATSTAYTATITVTDNLTGTGSNTFTANVSAPISPITVTSPGTQSSTAAVSHTFALGSFTDPNGGATTWTETINWGDSSSNSLTLPPGSLGNLAHTYATSAAYTVTVTVTDNLTATGSNTFTANVSAAISPITVTSPGTQSNTAGVSHAFALGSFTDPNGGATTWTETINWGDSSSSTLNLPPGSLGNLAHTYATSAAYTVTVTVTDNLTATGYNAFTANVSAAISSITVTSPGAQASTAGVSQAFTLGSFTDPNAASSWTEVINWGDSSSSTLTLPPGSLGTLGHIYASSGSYPVIVTVTDNLTGTGSNSFTASVSESILPITVTSPGTQSTTAGVSQAFPLGSFTDPNGASSWIETINWGDSTSSTLNLPPGSLGNLAHTYATSAAYSVTVTVIDNLTGTGTNTFAANVSSSVLPITVTSPGTQGSVADSSHAFALGSFTDPNAASSWTETVNWGDSSSITLNLPPGSLGNLVHTYATSAAYSVTVTVTDNLTGVGSNSFTANVSPSVLPITVNAPPSQASTAGVSQAFALGSFSDPNAASSWIETINWGDSSTSTLNLPPGLLGMLNHTYVSAGSYPVTVTVTDNLTGIGSNAFSVNVSPAPVLDIMMNAVPFSKPVKSTARIQVASFTDTNTALGAGDYSVTILWNNGATTTGTISGSHGNFKVTSKHAYSHATANNGAIALISVWETASPSMRGSVRTTGTITHGGHSASPGADVFDRALSEVTIKKTRRGV
jgi:hypothetical protein